MFDEFLKQKSEPLKSPGLIHILMPILVGLSLSQSLRLILAALA